MRLWMNSLALSAAALMLVAGCAQDVGDIDRTQPNYLEKADFDGTWYFRQTVIDVPPRLYGPFVGVASSMEKLRWEIQEHYLIAYRSYELQPGTIENAGLRVDGETVYAEGFGEGRNDDEFKESPIAAFRIESHFDIQRQYNPSTGEQTNVISENGSDRPWHERGYFRVDWSTNYLTASYPGFLANTAASSFYVQENEGGIDAFYTEEGTIDGEEALTYFDFVSKVNFDGLSASAYCLDSACEVKVRNSFMRLEDVERDYEPAFYDDEMMTKFGYFRTNRYVYNRDTGYNDSSVVYLANRHDIWANDYQRDEDGDYLRDAKGRRIPTPMSERTPKPVVYYLSPNFPEELLPGAEAVAEDWNRAFTRSAAAVKEMSVAEFEEAYPDQPMFVLCHNPVREADPAACDPRTEAQKEADEGAPFTARAGDLRRSFIFWVDQPQMAGPLGYGPSYPDPESGELISGTAYVYGAGVDRYAGSGVDIVRLMNGDLSEDEIREGKNVLGRVLQNRNELDPRMKELDLPEALRDRPVGLDRRNEDLLGERQREILARVRLDGPEALRAEVGRKERILDKLQESGYDRLLVDDEYVLGVTDGEVDPAEYVNGERVDELLDQRNPFALKQWHDEEQKRLDLFARHNVYLEEFADPAVVATAMEFKGESDYDVIWNELRNRIFRGVMAHEVGHTLGLRHNFQGSYDAINFFDRYWELRKETFAVPQTVSDVYETNRLSQAQVDGGMPKYQYSSIMDYHSRFDGDTVGIGKYDEAAILFAYTFGTYDEVDPSNEEPLPAEPGYVEVFEEIPEAVTLPGASQPFPIRDIMHNYDDRYAASQHPLEDYHYTTIAHALGGPEKLDQRRLERYGELRRLQLDDDETRPVEVPYMFCSDEWAGATISCDRWDLGADPFEKVQWAVRQYETYYPLNNFRRDRLQFSVGSVINRAYRSFGVMPQVYKRWLLDQYYLRDGVLDFYYQIAAFSGLNFLGDVLKRPQYGRYVLDEEDDQYVLGSYNPEYEFDGYEQLSIYPGQGRRQFSSYDYGSGYYYFTRVEEVGHYWDWRVALEMLTADSSTAVLGVDDTADFRTYVIPYYLVFPDQMTELINGFYRTDHDVVSYRASSEGLRGEHIYDLPLDQNTVIDPMTGSAVERLNGEKTVRNQVYFSQRLYALLFGTAFFASSSYSPDFIDQARVFRVGTAEQVTPLTPELCQQLNIEGVCDTSREIVSFVDPDSGVAYGAIRRTGGSSNPGLAEKLILDGQRLLVALDGLETALDNLEQQYNSATSDAQRDQIAREYNDRLDDLRSRQRDFDDTVDDAAMLMDIVDIFGSVW